MAEIGCNWAKIGPSKSSQSLSNAHKWAVRSLPRVETVRHRDHFGTLKSVRWYLLLNETRTKLTEDPLGQTSIRCTRRWLEWRKRSIPRSEKQPNSDTGHWKSRDKRRKTLEEGNWRSERPLKGLPSLGPSGTLGNAHMVPYVQLHLNRGREEEACEGPSGNSQHQADRNMERRIEDSWSVSKLNWYVLKGPPECMKIMDSCWSQ
ncbi:hypothetical protein Tco_1315656 [Tanacetum coccineum]